MPVPPFVYHATSRANAPLIAVGGLQPRSGPPDNRYLCVSGILSGATTLQRKANDVVFRIATANFPADTFYQEGAGLNEWRSRVTLPGSTMQYRRYLGSPAQIAFRPVANPFVDLG